MSWRTFDSFYWHLREISVCSHMKASGYLKVGEVNPVLMNMWIRAGYKVRGKFCVSLWLDWMLSPGNGRKKYFSTFLETTESVGTLPLKLEIAFYRTSFQNTWSLNQKWTFNFKLNYLSWCFYSHSSSKILMYSIFLKL